MENIKCENTKSKELYVMVGIPGSGKTFLGKDLAARKGAIYISRDEVRFSLLKDGEDYFSREVEVFDVFIDKIQLALDSGQSVVVDATHINRSSRVKLLYELNLVGVNPNAIIVRAPLAACLDRNEEREGLAKVPARVIIDMHQRFVSPSATEGFRTVVSIDNRFEPRRD